MSESKPTYVYKIVSHEDPPFDPKDPMGSLVDVLPLSSLDTTSGFIHLSTSLQIPNTLKFFFGNDPLVYIMKINYDIVDNNIRWEDPKAEVCGPRGGEGMFPHLYNARLGKQATEDIVTWKRREDGWDSLLSEAASWLVY